VKRAASLILALLLFTGFSTATVTSADSITYTGENGDFFDGSLFAIQVASDQATDKIDIHLDKSELSQQVDGDVQQDLTIDIVSQDTSLKYSTTPSSELRDVRTVTPYHEEGFSTADDAIRAIKNKCYDLNGNGEGSGVYDYRVSSFSYEIWCFQQSKYLGTPAYLDNPDEIFTTNIELQAEGKTLQSATLSNGEAGSGVITKLGQHAKIRWNGNLRTGAAKPDNSRVYALHANRYSGSWRIVGQEAYDDYKTYLENEAFEDLKTWGLDDDGAYISGWTAASRLNDRAWGAAEVDTSSDLAYTTVADSSLNSGAFSFDTEDLLVYPLFTIYVDAGEDGYIEVSKPTGDPEIISTTSTEIPENGTGTISTEVKNVGDGQGSFSARLTSCSDGFIFSDTQKIKTAYPGNTVSYSLGVSFNSVNMEQREITGSCTLEVQDTTTGVSDSTRISLTGVQISGCGNLNAGDQKPFYNSEGLWEIRECKQNEQGFKVVATCDEGEKAVAQGGNTFACEKTGGSGGGGTGPGSGGNPFGFLSGFFGGSGSGGLLAQIHLGLSLLAGILSAAVGYKGSRWVDGEYRVQGSFEPFKSRSIDRVSRGRFIVGAVGGVLGFMVGTLVALQVALVVQLVVIAGIAVLLYYKPW